jgi:hypothetical protein
MNTCINIYSVMNNQPGKKQHQSALGRQAIGGVFHKEKERPVEKKTMNDRLPLASNQIQMWLKLKLLSVFQSVHPLKGWESTGLEVA